MAKNEINLTKHARANREYLKGNYAEAIRLQVEVVNEHISQGKKAITSRKLLAVYLYSSGEAEAAITLLRTLFDETPEDSEVPENIGVMLRKMGKIEESVEYFLLAHKMSPQKSNVCDGLAHSFHILKQPDQVQEFGRRSLELKDQSAIHAKSWSVPLGAPPVFEGRKKSRNIISFSLFGDDPRYLQGALRNARISAELYPGWTCRFYCDPQVPESVILELKSCHCEIVMRPEPENFYAGLLWRLEVMDDPTIDRFLVRDCDSVINIKERVAVDQWLASDKWFHMMRDFPSHTELILAGMWGGVSGVLPSIEELAEGFSHHGIPTRSYDQLLLRTMVWPTMRKSVLIHDSVYTGCLSSVPFPEFGKLPSDRHIGQNEVEVVKQTPLVSPQKNHGTDLVRFFVVGMNHSGITYLRNLLNFHSGIFCPAQHHLTSLWKNSDRSVNTYCKAFDEINPDKGKLELDREKIRKELFETWIKHLFDNYREEATSHVGIADHSLDVNLAYHAAMTPHVKFIYITRDPRDLLVARCKHKKVSEPGFDRDHTQVDELAKSIANQWVQKLKNVQSFNKEEAGRIELVRYEDLVSSEKRIATLDRILRFLEIPGSPEMAKGLFDKHELEDLKVSAFGEGKGSENKSTVGSWEDALSIRQIDAIQKRGARLMELLHYKILPIDGRKLASGDTILPS